MDAEEFERVFKKCYNPSITDFKERNGEEWYEAPDWAEQCNHVEKSAKKKRKNDPDRRASQ